MKSAKWSDKIGVFNKELDSNQGKWTVNSVKTREPNTYGVRGAITTKRPDTTISDMYNEREGINTYNKLK